LNITFAENGKDWLGWVSNTKEEKQQSKSDNNTFGVVGPLRH
jgi:hypothetical protein